MKKLSTKEMQQVRGGGWCGTLGAITGISCMAGMMVACGIGLVGGAALCGE